MSAIRMTAALAALAMLAAVGTSTATAVSAAELTQRCTNPDDGYSVGVPRGWYWNEAVDGGDLDDVAACRFFSPQDFEVRPASQAAGIAVAIGREATPPRSEGEATTVDGRDAIILETVAGEDSFDPAGTRTYQYWTDMGEDWLVATTSDGPNWVGEYDENRETLDAMMDSLTFAPTSLPDTAVAAPTQAPTIVAGMALIVLALGGVTRTVRED